MKLALALVSLILTLCQFASGQNSPREITNSDIGKRDQGRKECGLSLTEEHYRKLK